MSSSLPVVFASGTQGTLRPPQGKEEKYALEIKDAQGRTHIIACTLLTETAQPQGKTRQLYNKVYYNKVYFTEITCSPPQGSGAETRVIHLLVPNHTLLPFRAQLTGPAVVRPQRLPELQGRSSSLPQPLLEQVMQFLEEDDDRDVACEILSGVTIPEGEDPVTYLSPILEQASLFPATDKLELLPFFAALHQQGRLIPRSLAIDTLLNQVVPHLSLYPVQRAQLFHLILSGQEPSIPALERLGNALAHPPNPPGTYSRQECVARLVAGLVVPQATYEFLQNAVAFLRSSPFQVLDLSTFLVEAWNISTVHKLPQERVFTEAARLAGVEHPRLQPPAAPQQTEEPVREPSTLSPVLLEKVDQLWSKNSEKNQACRFLSAIAVPQGTDPEAYLSPIFEQVSRFPAPHNLELIPVFAELHQQQRLNPLSSMIQDLLTKVLPCFAHSDVARGQLLQFILSCPQSVLETPEAAKVLGRMLLATSQDSLEELHARLIQLIGFIVCPENRTIVHIARPFLQAEPPVLDLVQFFTLIDKQTDLTDLDARFTDAANRAREKKPVT